MTGGDVGDSGEAPRPPDWLAPWCRTHLGSAPVETLLHPAQMSSVFGLRLADGRRVVVKARDDEDGRAAACVLAQAQLAGRGFPCAGPLTPAVMTGSSAAHAEQWRPGGAMLRGDTPRIARLYAEVFARLMTELAQVRVDPPLPNPYWLRWEHPGPGLWPSKVFLDERDASLIPDLVVGTVTRATRRLLRADLPCVLGYADFEAQNLRWHGEQLWTVHDWDSLAWLPEAALVGAASGSFASAEVPTLAPLESSAVFIDSYQQLTGRAFTADELQVAWAASLWPAGHNARGEALFGRPAVAGAALAEQAAERLRLAGA